MNVRFHQAVVLCLTLVVDLGGHWPACKSNLQGKLQTFRCVLS